MKYLLTNENFFKNIFKKKETPKQKLMKDWEWMFGFDKYDNYGINSDILDGYYTIFDTNVKPKIQIQYDVEYNEENIRTMLEIESDKVMLQWRTNSTFDQTGKSTIARIYSIDILEDNLNKREKLLEFLELSEEYIRA